MSVQGDRWLNGGSTMDTIGLVAAGVVIFVLIARGIPFWRLGRVETPPRKAFTRRDVGEMAGRLAAAAAWPRPPASLNCHLHLISPSRNVEQTAERMLPLLIDSVVIRGAGRGRQR